MAFDITQDHQLVDDTPTNGDTVLGNEADVKFISVGNKTVRGKIDTGATTSSLHATNISINKESNNVTFSSPAISDNIITMDLEGAQEVQSADAGGTSRPMVKFDIEVDGTPINGVLFNLNDRGNMDTMVLIGQNVLKAGKFTIDVNKDDSESSDLPDSPQQSESRSDLIHQAMRTLAENHVSIADIVAFMRSEVENHKG